MDMGVEAPSIQHSRRTEGASGARKKKVGPTRIDASAPPLSLVGYPSYSPSFLPVVASADGDTRPPLRPTSVKLSTCSRHPPPHPVTGP